MKFGRIVLQVNTHRLTESDFRFDVKRSRWRRWRHCTQKSAAICGVHIHQRPVAVR